MIRSEVKKLINFLPPPHPTPPFLSFLIHLTSRKSLTGNSASTRSILCWSQSSIVNKETKEKTKKKIGTESWLFKVIHELMCKGTTVGDDDVGVTEEKAIQCKKIEAPTNLSKENAMKKPPPGPLPKPETPSLP